MNKYFSILISIAPCFSYAQGNPYAVWENPNTSVFWFVSLDATTGVKLDISTIPGVTNFVAGNAATFNTDSTQYVFLGLDGASIRIYTIDAATGNVLYSPLLAGNLVDLNYNCNDGKLYGMMITGNSYDLVLANPVTGAVFRIAPLTGFTAYVGESFSFNPFAQQLNMVVYSGGFRLRSYDVITGQMVNDNPFPDNVTAHQFNCADSSLYGLWENNNLYKFEKINVSTGIHSTVSTLSGVTPGYVGESSCMDLFGNYIYRGFDSLNNFSLITIEAASGHVTNIVNTSDNAVGFEVESCCSGIQSIVAANGYSGGVSIFPNPFTEQIDLVCKKNIRKSVLYSYLGKKIIEESPATESGTQTLFVPELLPGIYFLVITCSDGSTLSGKLLHL